MATIHGQINTPRDTTIQATNTALGLLGKDASLQDIKTALLAIVAAITPSIENDYDELTNKPQVNGVTLSGNKTSKQLGIRQTIPMNSAAYALLTSAEKMDPDKDYIITDINATSAPIDDNNTSNNKVWSSQKTDNTKADKEAILQTVEECSASTDPDDIAGAAALSSLNSAMVKKDTNYNLDAAVDLSNYTGTNKYTCPSDGYLNLQFGTGSRLVAISSCLIEGNNESVHFYFQAYANNNKDANVQGELIQVKKGFKISHFECDNANANAKLFYSPFTEAT